MLDVRKYLRWFVIGIDTTLFDPQANSFRYCATAHRLTISYIIKDQLFFSLDKYRCRSGECIDTETVCNGEVDCTDGSDEEENICLKITCPKNAFRCRYGACVPKSFRCTGTSRCADGSDEDELLCGAHYNVYLIKGNLTGKIPPGSCRLPSRNDLRYINSIFGEEYMPGGYVNDGEYIEIVCKGGTTMNVSMDFDSSNSCDRTKWTRKWSLFPECQSKFQKFKDPKKKKKS